MKTGTTVIRDELVSRGFAPHQLKFRTGFSGSNSECDTLGHVPDSAGLYAFVLTHPDMPGAMSVASVGLTGNLWMVTKGRLPDGCSRPAQRYGRFRYAGATRARVNGYITEAKRAGHDVTHWLSPRSTAPGVRADVALRSPEEELITLWDLRRTGWNRG